MLRNSLLILLQISVVWPLHAQSSLDASRVDALNQRAESFRGIHPDSMVRIGTMALEHSKTIRYRKGEAEAYRWIGLGKILGGDTDVDELLNRSTRILTELGDRIGLASTINIVATAHFQRGEYVNAGKRWHEALEIYRSVGDSTSMINMKNNIGNLHRAMRQFETALGYHQEALAYRENRDDTLSWAGSLNNVANLLNELGRHQEAVAYHERALTLNTGIRNLRSIGNSLTNLGSTHIRLGNPDLALEYLVRALAIRKESQDLRGQSTVLSAMADAYLSKGEPAFAAEHALRAFELADRLRLPMEASISSRFAYIALKGIGNTRDALRYFEIHKSLSDSLFNLDRQKAVASLESTTELNRRNDQLRLLEQEKQQNRTLLGVILAILALAMLFTYWVYQTRQRDRRYSLELRRLGELKDQMLSILSHDLRTPLSSLHSMIGLMDMDVLTQNEWAKFKGSLSRQFQATDQTLRDVLIWAKGQFEGRQPNHEAISLSETVLMNTELLRLVAEQKQVVLDTDIPPQATVMVDRSHLMAIIRNLLSNAIKFTPAGKRVRLYCKEHGSETTLFIQDDGVGMSTNRMDQLFSHPGLFSAGTQGETGSGLGLMFVNDLVARNGGRIEIKSEPNKGTTVAVTLPTR